MSNSIEMKWEPTWTLQSLAETLDYRLCLEAGNSLILNDLITPPIITVIITVMITVIVTLGKTQR